MLKTGCPPVWGCGFAQYHDGTERWNKWAEKEMWSHGGSGTYSIKRCNVQILGDCEMPESSFTTAVAKLLTEVLQLDKTSLINHSQQTLSGKKSGDKPRVIVAKLHYYQDCIKILWHAPSRSQWPFKDSPILTTADYTANVAKAWAAFTEVRRLHCSWRDVRYRLLLFSQAFMSWFYYAPWSS